MSEPRDAVATMGTVLPADVGGRDAVHVAVISVVAGATMDPGTPVGFREDDMANDEYIAVSGLDSMKLIGIVDPFLEKPIKAGQRFWLYIYPRTITGLKHVWEHPMIPEGNPRKKASEEWLRGYFNHSDSPFSSYEEMIAAACMENGEKLTSLEDDYDNCGVRKSGEHWTSFGRDAYGEIPDEFWDHVETVTGKTIKDRPSYYSCSC